MAKLTLLKKTSAPDARFHSNWGMAYEVDVPADIPVHFAISYMTDDNTKVEFEHGDLDGLDENLVADMAENLGMERSATLTQVKKAVLPARSATKKAVSAVSSALTSKKSEEEKAPEEESESEE